MNKYEIAQKMLDRCNELGTMELPSEEALKAMKEQAALPAATAPATETAETNAFPPCAETADAAPIAASAPDPEKEVAASDATAPQASDVPAKKTI